MRHYIYILCSFCIALATLSSCSLDEMFDGKKDSESNGKIVLNCSAVFPGSTVDTKTLGEATSTTIKSLYLVIFDENGNLLEIDKAVPGTYNIPNDTFTPDGNAENETVFHVEVTPSSSTKRIIHFVANYDVIHANLGAEYDVMNKMYTANGNDAYWQRVEVPSLTDQTHFDKVPLIRNFLKITLQLSSSVTNFSVTGYFLYNMNNSGSVAPFNINTATTTANRFANYIDDSGNMRKYSYMHDTEKYSGCEPGNVALDNPSLTSITWKDLTASPSSYVYESTYKPNDTKYPCMIIRGRYGSNNETYYKADFSYTKNNVTTHYDLIRNFEYKIIITKVQGDGYPTVDAAINGLPMNDLIGAATSADINNISANSQHLYVNTTDEMIVDDAHTFTIAYKNVINTDKPSEPNYNGVNNNVKTATETTNPITITGLTGDVGTGVVSSADETSGTYTQYRTITFTPNAIQPGRVLKQTITITNAAGLARTVTLTLRKPLELNLACTPTTVSSSATDIDLTLTIPAGLTKYRFPMDFYIESDKNNVYPNSTVATYAEMPVVTGTSLTGNGLNSYSFKRTITFEEYDAATTSAEGTKTFDCHFLAYKGGTNVSTKFYVKTNQYFKDVTVQSPAFTVNF
jgi:hypothetical protein